MLKSVFVTVLCMAAVGGAGYGVLKLADLTLGGRMGQRTRCRWAAIVAAEHLVPVHFLWRLVPVRVELVKAGPTTVAGSGFSGHVAAPVQGAVVGAGPSFAVGTGAGTVETVKSAAAVGRMDILKILAAVWLAGACVCALWSLWRFLKARRALIGGGAEASPELYAAASDAARELGIRKTPVVRTCPGLGSPTLVGFLRPVILMPEAELTEGQARMLFAHELTHFKRGDLWKKALMNAVRAVQWYDPAVWMLGRDLEYWIETACDEAVAGPMEKERRREYGYLLIEFATASRPTGVPLGSGRRKLERRIKTMMKSTKKKRAIIGAALALAILAGCVGVSAIAAGFDPNVVDVPDVAPDKETLIADDTGVVDVPDEAPDGETLIAGDAGVVVVPDDDGGAVPEVELITELDLSAMGPTADGNLAANMGYVYANKMIAEGQSLTISASYTPAENSLKVGYVDADGKFTYDTITGGSGTSTFTMDASGEYKIYISNPSETGIYFSVSYIVT